MDQRKRTKKDKKFPRVPIKTYKWEDINRARKRGGYPWTYLYKKPFDEEVDAEDYTMSALRKSKSSSTMGRSEGVQISDVTEHGEEEESRMDSLQIVTEPDDRSTRNSIGSIVIEECEMSDPGEEDKQRPETVALESADSSDNISQYLDKEDRVPDKELGLKESNTTEETIEDKKEEEATPVPEEQSNRKRKMSAESSYSRISLTKDAVLKKIRDAKNKIKVPKLSFPVKKIKKPIPKTTKAVPPETKKESKKQAARAQPKNVKPVYIHIPLKPPPGQTDEFSYLEFEEKQPQTSSQPLKGVGSFKLLAKNIKRLQETLPNTEEVSEEEPSAKTLKKDSDILKDKDQIEEKESPEKDSTPNEESTEEIKHKEGNDGFRVVEVTSEIILIVQEDAEPSEGSISRLTGEAPDKKGILKKSTEAIDSAGSSHTDILKGRQERAKSEEPQRKRKLSLESAYSRKSLSKLEFMKKLRETSEKLKKTFSFSRKKKTPELEKPPPTKVSAPEKQKKKQKPEEPVKPVYIHIPLKPDEDEEKIPEDETSQPSNTPESPVPSDVQLIILTAPSDDEILDYHSSDVPDTPSSESKVFFANKVDELKKLAKEAVNDITTPTHKLDPVTEETSNGDKQDTDEVSTVTTVSDSAQKELISPKEKPNDIIKKVEETQVKVAEAVGKTQDQIPDKRKVTIDVEDGLSESLVKEDKQELPVEQVDSSEGKTEEATLNLEDAPTIKKKVSFRRRSKTPKDGSYEEIGPQKILGDLEGQQEETVLDSSHLVKDEQLVDSDKNVVASSKEDEDKWSKTSDHEYEPVNPPPEVQIISSSTPTLNVLEDTNNLQSNNRYPEFVPLKSDSPIKESMVYRIDTTNSQREIVTSLAQHDDNTQNQDPGNLSDKSKDPNKFQQAWKQTTDQFKNKLRNMKKPHTNEANKKPVSKKFTFDTSRFKPKPRRTQEEKPKPRKSEEDEPKPRKSEGDEPKPRKSEDDKPKLRKFKFETPKFNLPKMPDTSKINLPSMPTFKMPRRNSGKRTKERQQSTESNAGDSKKISFDFSTYPRVFSKLRRKSAPKKEEFLDLASTPKPETQEENKRWSDSGSVRIPLHFEESVGDENRRKANEVDVEFQPKNDDERNDYLEDDILASHIRYKDDIDIDDDDDEFEGREINNDEYLARWNHGNFNPDIDAEYQKQFENSRYEVTDLDFPDEMERQRFDYNSNQKERERYSSGSSFGGQRIAGVLEEINPDEFFLRQKGISQDNIEVGMYLSSEIKEAFRTPENALSKMEDLDFNLDDSNQSLHETPTKRKPIKKPKRKKTPHVSQERISHVDSDDEDFDAAPPSRPKRRSKRTRKPKHPENVIPYQETIPVETELQTEFPTEENINNLSNYKRETEIRGDDEDDALLGYRKLITDSDNLNFEYIDDGQIESQIEKPAAPPRKHKSLKSLTSENDSILEDLNSQILTSGFDNGTNKREPDFTASTTYPLKRPSRKKSRTSLQSQTSSQSKEIPQKDEEYLSSSSQLFTSENQIPCVEEPCVQDIRDHMGYAIIDKQKIRDPPLPPPRSPSRKKRSIKTTESNFFTVPRQSRYDDAPVRPLRNYSTLGQAKKANEPPTYENKENIDIIQYIEIEDEPNRDLQSGDVIQKMKDRPLPAPPRPPRKSRVLQNITSKENIMSEIRTPSETPIPDDDVCEEDQHEISKTETVSEPIKTIENNEKYPVEKRLITPDYFTHQETITHGSLIVQSLNGDKILRDSDLTYRSEERIIPVSTESEDETSSVPEDFKKLKDPPEEVNIQVTSPPNTEVEVLKAHKLQVVDLDVDTLTVNKLLAGRIIVSEIDSHSILTDEINTKFNAVQRADEDSKPTVMVEKQIEVKSQEPVDDSVKQKKTSIDLGPEPFEIETHADYALEETISNETTQNQTDSFNQESSDLQSDPPLPPPRSSTVKIESSSRSPPPQAPEPILTQEGIQELDVDDEPPPRPPQPHLDYMPSQPPPSFYALRAQKYVDSAETNIPKIPRRKRPPRSVSKSSSEDSVVVPPVARRFHNRSPEEPSISDLSGQLIRACGSTACSALKRLITDITNKVKKNADGKLDLHVMTIILLILIAGLILLGYGEEKTVVHLHHWEFFNPPRDL